MAKIRLRGGAEMTLSSANQRLKISNSDHRFSI
jgi:hypothetical protein